MAWLYIAFISYALNAAASVIDKTLLKKRIPEPLTYAFYTGITSIGVVFLMPFGFSLIPFLHMLLAFSSGGSFVIAFYYFYLAVKNYDVSRVVPLVFGVCTPILTLLFSHVIFQESLLQQELSAFIFFVLGGIVLMLHGSKRGLVFDRTLITLALVSGIFFALSFSITEKVLDLIDNFFNAFVWMRLGSVFLALLIFVTPLRKRLVHSMNKVSHSSFFIFLINKILGAVAFLLLIYAIELSDGSLVISLRGIEYLFVFFITIAMSFRYPHILNEVLTLRNVSQKILGILLVGIGIFILKFKEFISLL